MEPAFLWALIATAAAGIQVFGQKIVAHEHRDAALNGVIGFGISTAIAFVLFVYTSDVPAQWRFISVVSLCAGVALGISSYYRIEALKHIDSVIYFPINKVLGPVLVVAIGIFFLHERFSVVQGVGILLSLLVPVLLISSTEKHRQLNLRRGLIFLAISTFLAAVTAPMQKIVTNLNPPLVFAIFVWQIAATVISAVVYMRLKSVPLRAVRLHPRDVQLGMLMGLLQFLSSYAFIKAVSLGLVSIFYVIHAHYILIPIILSVWWYKDHINTRKLVAIAVSSAAIILLGI